MSEVCQGQSSNLSAPASTPASESYASFFAGKRITLMGLGLLGRGVGDAAFLAGCGAALTVTDLKSAQELAPSLEKLAAFPDIAFALGGHREQDFRTCDMVIKAAGVPLDSPYLDEAMKNGVPVYMSTALFAKLSPAVIVGVTGTRGKSTTAWMIYEALRQTFGREEQKQKQKVHLGGNIRDMSTLALLPDVAPGDIAVLELDSWQLQGFRDLGISPHVAVFTSFMPDHMNYYSGDLERYFHDKAAIYAHQRPGDYLIAGPDVAQKISAGAPPVAVCEAPALPDDWALSVPGAHNRQNAACALAALEALGLKEDGARPCLESFTAMDGRLALVAECDGVRVYNDSNATTPEATLAALRSFEAGKILLLAGGADKNLALEDLAAAIPKCCKATAFLSGTGTARLTAGLLPDVPVFDGLESAFAHLLEQAAPGDILLFSPAFASFGLFKNEYDRSDQFKALALSYQGKTPGGKDEYGGKDQPGRNDKHGGKSA